jgi:hypothetical protein
MKSSLLPRKASTIALPDGEVLTAHETGDELRKADLTDTITRVTYYLNLKEPPTNQQIDMVADFLRSEFAHLTTEDVLLAFKKAASGKLGIDPQAFNNMSIFYWGKILNAYNEFLKEQRLHYREPIKVSEGEPYDFLNPYPMSEETKAKVDALIAELVAKKTLPKGYEKVEPREDEILHKHLVNAWHNERLVWCKENQRPIQDYPVTLESFVSAQLTA